MSVRSCWWEMHERRVNCVEGVFEADPEEIVWIQVDPVRFVKEREEVVVPLCRKRQEFPDGGVW